MSKQQNIMFLKARKFKKQRKFKLWINYLTELTKDNYPEFLELNLLNDQVNYGINRISTDE